MLSSSQHNQAIADTRTDPQRISLQDLLTRDYVEECVGPMREGGSSVFAGVFVFVDEQIILIDELYGAPLLACPPEVLAIAAAVRDTGRERYICTAENSMIAGYPIVLRYGGESYLKGCFVGKPPLRDLGYLGAIRQIIKLFADLFSEHASSAFAARIAQRDYLKLEHELSLGTSQIASIIDSLGSGLALMDCNMRVVWSNALMSQWAATPDINGKICYEAARGRDVPCEGCLVRRTFETGQPQIGPMTMESERIGTHHFHVTTTPVFDDQGEVKQVLELIYDVTAARTAESELARYKRLVNGSDDFMLVCDESGSILAVNRKIIDALGYAEEELVGSDCRILVGEDESGSGDGLVIKAQVGGKTTDVIHLVRKDGSLVPTQVISTYDSDNRVYECIFRDISERLRMAAAIQSQNDELQAQNTKVLAAIEEKNRFFRNVSHEFRTPLTSVIAFGKLLMEDTVEPLTEHQRTALDRVVGSAYKLLDLVNDLLDLSKLESHKMTVELACVNLRDLLLQVLGNLRPLAAEKGLEIDLNAPDDLPEIRTDEQKLGHIMVNLVSNAIKFTPEGSITVSASTNCKSVSISVRDTGIGIPEHELSEIFKEFFQGTTRGKQRGTGLGLAIALRLATLLGGGITVQSEDEVGSTFTLKLPLTPISSPR